MKKILSLCLFMLITLLPGICHAQNSEYEQQAMTQFANEVSRMTS